MLFLTLAQDVDKLQDLYGKIKSEIMQQKIDFLTLIDIQEKDGIVTMRFVGNGFRRYMVRLISGALIQVGSHWRTKEFVEDLLKSKGKKKCLFKAKPEGLYLQEVYYEEND